jgi:hypothetical protein
VGVFVFVFLFFLFFYKVVVGSDEDKMGMVNVELANCFHFHFRFLFLFLLPHSNRGLPCLGGNDISTELHVCIYIHTFPLATLRLWRETQSMVGTELVCYFGVLHNTDILYTMLTFGMLSYCLCCKYWQFHQCLWAGKRQREKCR